LQQVRFPEVRLDGAAVMLVRTRRFFAASQQNAGCILFFPALFDTAAASK
jgi:hypothetical protein